MSAENSSPEEQFRINAMTTKGLPDSNYGNVVRHGLWLLAVGFGGFMLWAIFAPVDAGAPAPGTVSVESTRKRIDHLTGGIVEKILVREGQRVSMGDPLIVFNEAQVKASLNAAESMWRTATLTVSRLDAERSGAKTIPFPAEFRANSADTTLSALMAAQEELFLARRKAIEGELSIIRESVHGLEEQIRTLNELATRRELQIKLFSEQLAAFQKLYSQHFVSRVQLIEIERQLAEVQTKQSEDFANSAAVKARLAEFRMRGVQREIEYRKEVESQLTDARKDAALSQERLAATKDVYERLMLHAPVTGTIVDLAFHTVGGIIKPGDRIMDIVPEGDALVVEAKMPTQYIDRVRKDLPADVHFDAYTTLIMQPVVFGTVVRVSADTLTEQRTGIPYYSVRIAVPAGELNKLGNFKIQPGMQVTVIVKTGERSMMSYLLQPLVRRFSTSMGEN